jgi:putative ABC transport system permease protein
MLLLANTSWRTAWSNFKYGHFGGCAGCWGFGTLQLAAYGSCANWEYTSGVELADALASELNVPVAAVILLRGTASSDRREGRVGHVQVVGVTDAFWRLGGTDPLPLPPESVILNERLAHKLRVCAGEEVILRVEKPSLLSRDAPLSTVMDASITLRLPVAAIADDRHFGRFSLEANQIPPCNAFVPMELLQRKLGLRGRANALLVGAKRALPLPSEAASALWRHWQLTDANLELRKISHPHGVLELRTERVFLEPMIGDAAMKASPDAQGVLTYFVKELRIGNRWTPYSTVAALEGAVVPRDMKDDEILINQWLADDMQAKVGDTLKLTYWLAGPMRRLTEHSSTFRVRGIVPMKGDAIDPELMPTFPGLAGKKDCRDWEPGVPIDLSRIRDKDEQYWDTYRGVPKAFITLRAGQRIWNNRFGNLTAVRYPLGKHSPAEIEARIRQALNPASLGLFFVPVREQALSASQQGLDFGQLFLGFSFFLIAAALLLAALLFALGVEQRAEEIGTLLAVGFPPGRVQRLLLAEGSMLALLASVGGVFLAVMYTRAIVFGLSTVWREAVANSALQYYTEPATLVIGGITGFLVALMVIWLVVRRQARAPICALLAPGAAFKTWMIGTHPAVGEMKRSGLPTVVVAVGGAMVLVSAAIAGKHEQVAGYFFGAGALLLIGGIALCRLLMSVMEQGVAARSFSVTTLGIRNTSRRLERSLATIGLLACGCFLVVAIGANRHDPYEDALRRTSGTGGFAFYGETALPIFYDLNTPEGREEFGLDAEALPGLQVIPLRLREGDEASCLNLNRAQSPRLVGVQPEALRKRRAFTFLKTLKGAGATEKDSPWSLLEVSVPDGAIPVVGDVNTVVWSLGKSLGDTLHYVDEKGRTQRLRIVGLMANSILQGSLILSEEYFLKLFPSQSGYQVFLVEVAPSHTAKVAGIFTRALEDVGIDLIPAAERLADFNTVEGTYLSIFAILGGLGLLLGSGGLGAVVLRNVLERRSELALLGAVGFPKTILHRLIFSEHVLLLFLGLVVGVVSALVAALPALRSPGANVPYASLSATLAAIFASGLIWTWAATTMSVRGSLLDALRNE